MKKSGFIKDAMILFVITLVSGILLGFVHQITLEPIARTKDNSKVAAYKKVFPKAKKYETLSADSDLKLIETVNEELMSKDFGKVSIHEVALAKNGSETLGYVVTSSSMEGFGGEIVLTIGLTASGSINGIEFLTLAETPGLGMMAKEERFTSQYVGRDVAKFEVVKSGQSGDNSIEALSGATITSKAVTGAVNAALFYVQNVGGM